MKNKSKITKVLLLGSGALQIGQAGEFDYSGSQAIKALKEEGIKVILVNPNIATIQTSEEFADEVYFLPVEPYFVEQVIKSEKPQGILLSFGGQTALNCGLEMEKAGTFKKYNVQILGTPIAAIKTTEDRHLFAQMLKQIELLAPQSQAAASFPQAKKIAEKLGYPIMVRSAFSLGGQDSGVAHNQKELEIIAYKALAKVPQILIEEYLAGWKEIEYEVVRDKYDNCITVCNMENVDPMGIHTGESIVVAPSQTLNNDEYHQLREIALKVIRKLEIVGECNIQYALNPNPKNSRLDYRIIEVNARLSRSSALASKATGYPLAYVAAKLGLGYGLTEIKNSVTKKTIACFEPALDYVVVKFPRWDLGKFIKSENVIGSSMQSVGEVMAIGRKFEEAIQKACRMLDVGANGIVYEKASNVDYKMPTPWRLFAIANAIKSGEEISTIENQTKINPFFLAKIKNITDFENQKPQLTGENLLRAKKLGFSDKRLAKIYETKEEKIRSLRAKNKIHPKVLQIDTLAAEYPAQTNYLYLTYNAEADDIYDLRFKIKDSANPKSIIVLGSGSYRIGSSVEFDWCSVTCAKTAKEEGFSTIIVNCNPETVSTDYDMADKLYFDELSLETVLEICAKENPYGVVVSMGGQTPNNLALDLHLQKIKVLGTAPNHIDQAEDRHKFSKLCDSLGVDQPKWANFKDIKKAVIFAKKIGFPVLVRPSYVLSGVAFNVAFDEVDLETYLSAASQVSEKYPVVISKFIQNSKEIEIDAVANKGEMVCFAISEHVENAGVHSGDATLVLPPQKIYLETEKKIEDIAQDIAGALKITGPFNMQFLAKDNQVMVIETNLRASRSLPFVSKVTGVNFVKIATKVILGKPIEIANKKTYENISYVGVKAPQFSFARIKGADPVLRVEMASTGEVACFGEDVNEAFLKCQLATGTKLPKKSVFISLAGDENKVKFLESAKLLKKAGLKIYATAGTSAFLKNHGIEVQMLYKIYEHKKPNVLDFLKSKDIDLVVNIIDPYFKKEFDDDYLIRRTAVDFGIPILTNLQTAELFASAFSQRKPETLKTLPWSAYLQNKF